MTAPEIVVANSFEECVARLDPTSAQRARAFLGKLAEDPQRGSLNFEIVRKQPDRKMRSARVSHELRAIAYVSGPTLTLLWVAHHDDAYSWARSMCVVCHPMTGKVLEVREVEPE